MKERKSVKKFKTGFTLAGGKCSRGQEGRKARGQEGKCLSGFTLAEVLIALAIIGVVAAMTIPSLMVKLDKVVKENQIKVFESKLQKGMDRMNLAGEIGPYYQTTEDFIKALSAHMRIVTICKAGELENCFPYESIQVQGLDEPVKVKEIDSGKSFGLNDAGYKDVAGMVLADGTPMLLTWNTECPVSDPDSSTRGGSKFGDNAGISTTACIKGIYDINGTRGPNLMLKDVLGYGGVATLKGGGVKIAGVKITKVITFSNNTLTPIPNSELCDDTSTLINNDYSENKYNTTTQLAKDLGIKYCIGNKTTGTDIWAAAVRECGGTQHVPDMDQLVAIIRTAFPNCSPNANYCSGYDAESDLGKLLTSAGHNEIKASFYSNYESGNITGRDLYTYYKDTDINNYSSLTRDMGYAYNNTKNYLVMLCID